MGKGKSYLTQGCDESAAPSGCVGRNPGDPKRWMEKGAEKARNAAGLKLTRLHCLLYVQGSCISRQTSNCRRLTGETTGTITARGHIPTL